MNGSITAIVPTYNRADLLDECLAALAAQSRPLLEVIVWDDGSTDHTEDVVRRARGNLRYFRSKNGGKSKALNAAMAQARGDYIWICDDDDLALPHAAEQLAAALDSDRDLVVSGGSYRRFRTDEATGARVETGPGYWPDLSRGSVLRHLLEDIFLFQNAMLVRRTAYAAVGPFREDLARSIDYDMIVRLAARFPVTIREEAVFLQRKHDGARGPAAARHAAAQSDLVWKAADRQVFAPFRKSLPLALFEAMYDTPDAAARRRAALLQRGCVYARRTDWQTALADFRDAAAVAPDQTLSPLETAICRRAMAGKHGCDEALSLPVRRELRGLAQSSAAGSAILGALLRGLGWRAKAAVRARDWARLATLVRATLALAPAARAGRSRAQPMTATIAERRHLPQSAYEAAA